MFCSNYGFKCMFKKWDVNFLLVFLLSMEAVQSSVITFDRFVITTSVNQNLTTNNKFQAANRFGKIINKSVYFDILEKTKMFMRRWPGTVDDPKLSSSLYRTDPPQVGMKCVIWRRIMGCLLLFCYCCCVQCFVVMSLN